VRSECLSAVAIGNAVLRDVPNYTVGSLSLALAQ
jgi:hypothetical protein